MTTGLVQAAVVINFALSFPATDARVTNRSNRTRTPSPSSTSLRNTLSSRTAGIRVAGVRLLGATVVLTDVPIPTVRVDNTFGTAACDSVRLWNEVGEAPADRGVVMVGGTGCARTAR